MKIEEIIAKYRLQKNPSFDDLLTELHGADEFMDRDAEIESLRSENGRLIEDAAEKEKELKETKALNFTLGRQVSRQPAMSADQIINEMFNK